MNDTTNIINLVKQDNLFTLLAAPTAWGKTSLCLDIIKEKKVIFLSPLKVISEEFYERAKEVKTPIFLGDNEQEVRSFNNVRRGTLVATAEAVLSNWDKLNLKNCLIIFDEFHLFLEWGRSFRPKLEEVFQRALISGASVLAMTATILDNELNYLRRVVSANYSLSAFLDLGNFKMKNKPTSWDKVYLYNDLDMVFHAYAKFKMTKKNTLLFVPTREKAINYYRELRTSDKRVLLCLGGEVDIFRENLSKFSGEIFIISTTALSHGANLPLIRNVYISYLVKNKSLEWQMIARGGRDGRGFKAYSLRSRPTLLSLKFLIESVLFKKAYLLGLL